MIAVELIEQTCGACPVQFEGELSDGRCFYFRARGGGWTFHIAATVGEAIATPPVAEGEDRHGGFMPAAVAESLILALATLNSKPEEAHNEG